MVQTMQGTEETLLAEIQRQLLEEFPSVSPLIVNAFIRNEHARFEGSRIRDFIPLFVEKRTRCDLKHIVNVPEGPASCHSAVLAP